MARIYVYSDYEFYLNLTNFLSILLVYCEPNNFFLLFFERKLMIYNCYRFSHVLWMGWRQPVVDQPRYRKKHDTSVLVRIRVRDIIIVMWILDVLRQQDPLHADEALQSRHVQELRQGRQVRLELLRIGRCPWEASGERCRSTQLLSVPQVSAHHINHCDPLTTNLLMAINIIISAPTMMVLAWLPVSLREMFNIRVTFDTYRILEMITSSD